MARRQPSMRWNREHRGKIVHRWFWQAMAHAWYINKYKPDGSRNRVPYPCWWGGNYRDGETAQKHWHVGRPTTNHSKGYPERWPGYPPESQTRNKV